MLKPTLPLLLLLLIATLCASCAPTIRIERLKPARYNDAAMLTNITIKPFTSPNGYYGSRDADALTRDIASILLDIEIDDRPFFSVTLDGDGYGTDRGVLNPGSAGLPGTLGGYGVMSGNLTQQRCSVTHYREKRKRCRKFKNKEYAPRTPPTLDDCIQWELYEVDCFTSTAEYGFDLTLKERKSKRVVYSLKSSDSEDSTACNSAPSRRTSRAFKHDLNSVFGVHYRYGYLQCEGWIGNRLITEAKEIALNKAHRKLLRDIAPHYVTETITLMNSDKEIESEEARQRLKKGVGYAKNLWLLKGCAEWEEADRLAPLNPSITYNLGVCAEFYGRYVEAVKLYNKALSLSDEPNKLINRSIERVMRSVEGEEALIEQMNNH
jgi:hypothetical protein